MNRLLWTALLCLAALAFLVAVAVDHNRRVSPPLGMPGPAPLVSGLNAAIHAFRSDLEGLQVVDGCKLVLQPADAPAAILHLLSIRVRRDSDPESGELELYLGAKESRREWLLLATDSWPAWAAAHSDINQLRARCASDNRNHAP
jgi:hypothetical protein